MELCLLGKYRQDVNNEITWYKCEGDTRKLESFIREAILELKGRDLQLWLLHFAIDFVVIYNSCAIRSEIAEFKYIIRRWRKNNMFPKFGIPWYRTNKLNGWIVYVVFDDHVRQ